MNAPEVKPLTQEELLAEAAKTELENARSLQVIHKVPGLWLTAQMHRHEGARHTLVTRQANHWLLHRFTSAVAGHTLLTWTFFRSPSCWLSVMYSPCHQADLITHSLLVQGKDAKRCSAAVETRSCSTSCRQTSFTLKLSSCIRLWFRSRCWRGRRR